jgi:small conductance mechanosensitive channel
MRAQGMLRRILLIIAIGMTGICPASAQETEAAEQKKATEPAQADALPQPAAQEPEELTEAQRIARLQRAIEKNEKLLEELMTKLKSPESEYARAEADFKAIDDKVEAKKKEVEQLKGQGKTEQVEAAQKELASLQETWTSARKLFDLAIQERKALQEQIAAINLKLSQDRKALAVLIEGPATQPATQPATGAADDVTPTQADQAAPQTNEQPAPAPAPAPTPTVPGPAGAVTEQPPAQQPQAEPKPLDEEAQKAKEQVERKEQEVAVAEEAAKSVSDRLAELKKTIEAQQTLIETAQLRINTLEEALTSARKQLDDPAAELDAAQRQQLQSQLETLPDRIAEAEQTLEERQEQLTDLEQQLAELQQEQEAAEEEAETARKEKEEAQSEFDKITNPFSINNMIEWLLTTGVRVVAVIVGVMLGLVAISVADKRITSWIAKRAERGSRRDRENRAQTLAGVFRNTARVVLVSAGLMTILQLLNFPVATLLGGAAVLGLAVAFGAQNLIRDYFSGFIILLENQYGVNDVVRIAGIAGLVERITLRVTVLRDLEGIVHFVPNGEITSVSNMTHGWSRALFDIGIAYKESVDQVMELLIELGREMRNDPKYSNLILDDPEMLGVDAFGDSAVVIKFFIKTRPLQQWTVKRELNRRIKNRFDELGIEIPFPHRTVFHRNEIPSMHEEESDQSQ